MAAASLRRLSMLRLLPLLMFTHAHSNFDSIAGFQGESYWGKVQLQQCDVRETHFFAMQPLQDVYRCFVYHMNLQFVKVEILNIDPPLIKYHQFLPRHLVNKFLADTRKVELDSLLVKKDNDANSNVLQPSRVVNGTFLNHHFSLGTSETFTYVQSRINAFNFDKAEQFQVLNYTAHGHYAAHYDFFDLNYDLEVKGNRLATFMAILQTADVGGGTIFPRMGVTFQPQPGDAVLWLNMDPDYAKALGSLHGACPVVKGVKVGLTLWVRSKGQELRYPCPLHPKDPFPLEPLTQPKWKASDWVLRFGFPLIS